MSEIERTEEELTIIEIDPPISDDLYLNDTEPHTGSHRFALAEVTDLAVQAHLLPHLAVNVEAIVAGHICLEIAPALTDSQTTFAAGHLIEAGQATISSGGPVSNTGLALNKLGITTRLMGKIGDDLFGQTILQLIASHGSGLTTGMIIAENEDTSYSLTLKPSASDPIIIHAPGCNNTFSAADIPYEFLETAGLFHFGYPPLMAPLYNDKGAELTRIFQQAKELGVTTSLALSLPALAKKPGKADWSTILTNTLPYVDIFLPSIEELLLLLRYHTFEKLAAKAGKHGTMLDYISPELFSELGKILLGMGAKVVAIKAGHRGLYLCTADLHALELLGRAQPLNLLAWANRELWAPCFSTQRVNDSGAGDATSAGFLMGLLRGMTPEATLSAACAVAACSIETPDTLDGIKSWPEIMERIAAGWMRLPVEKQGRSMLNMAASKWRWDEVHELWVGPADHSHQ